QLEAEVSEEIRKREKEELRILQLEAEVSEEIRKREKEELRILQLEADQRAIISARRIEYRNLVIAVTTLALLGLGTLLGWSRYNLELSESFNRRLTWTMIKEFNNFNRISLIIQDESTSSEKLALVAAIEASFLLNLPEQDVRQIAPEDFKEDKKTVRDTAILLQKAIKENLSDHGIDIVSKKKQTILSLDIAELPVDELHETLNKLRSVGCDLLLASEFPKSGALTKIIKARKIIGKCEPKMLIQPVSQ
ncbi:MAG: hypothetical protein AAFN93_24020, partial [Bacteroidota bacterium]